MKSQASIITRLLRTIFSPLIFVYNFVISIFSAIYAQRVRWLMLFGFSIAFFCIAFVVAASLYFVYYLYFIPILYVHQPLFFNFADYPPTAISTFIDADRTPISLSQGHPYDFYITLDMPESPANRHLGMFMVNFALLDENSNVVSNISRPVSLHYHSWLIYYFRTLMFALPLAFGFFRDHQNLVIPLVTELIPVDNIARLIVRLVTYQNREIHVSRASIDIRASLYGYRYFVAHWFYTTALVSIVSLQAFVFFTLWITCFTNIQKLISSVEADQHIDARPPAPVHHIHSPAPRVSKAAALLSLEDDSLAGSDHEPIASTGHASH